VAVREFDNPFAGFLPWNPDRADLQTTQTGVQFVAIRRGDPAGTHPKPQDQVEVSYDGRLARTGARIDATRPGQTATFLLTQMIPVWTEGMQKMVPGDEFMFFIPSRLAYGAQAMGPIPADADLVFLIDLKSVKAAPKADAAGWAKAAAWPADASKTGS